MSQPHDVRPTLVVEAGHHTGAIRRIAVSPDQTVLATVSDDKTARLWQIADRRLLMTLRWPIGAGDLGRLYGVAFSPDGRELAIGGTSAVDAGRGHRLQVFSATNGELLRSLPLDAGNVVRLLWMRSGRHLAACLSGGDGVRILANDGSSAFADSFGAPCFGLAELPDGALLASGYDGRIRMYREREGRWRLERQSSTDIADPRSLAVSPDGRHVAVGYSSRHTSGQAAVDVLDAGTLNLARRFWFSKLHQDQSGLGSVAWSRDGRTIAASGRATENGGYRLRVVLQRIAWPEGSTRSDFVATDTVQDITPLGDDGFVLATGLGSWATIGSRGDVTPLGATVTDLRGPDNLSIDAFARSVGFASEGWSGPRHFSLTRRELTRGAAQDVEAPRRESPALTVSDWQDRLRPRVAGRPVPMDSGEVSRAAALLPDNAGVLLGTSRNLRRFNAQGSVQWSVRTPSEVTAVHASKDGRLVVATLLDGTVRWWRASDGRLLLTLFTSIDDHWVLWTEDGYYDASPGAESLIGWQLPRGAERADFHAVGQFRERYHRPDVIDKVLETLDPRQALQDADRERQAYAAAVPPPAAPTEAPAAPGAEPEASRAPPVLRVFTERAVQSQSRELRIAFAVESRRPVDGLVLRIDGQLVEPAQLQMPRRHDGREAGAVILPMPERSAAVMLVAHAAGLASEPVFLAWNWRPPEPKTAGLPGLPAVPAASATLAAPVIAGLTLPAPPALAPAAFKLAPASAPTMGRQRMYLVAIGVSDYRDRGLKLDFPAKDAQDFADFMRAQEGRMYSTVETRTLVDGQATRAKVLEALDWLKSKVGAADIGMLFIAGHGLNDARGSYQFLTHDADLRDLGRTSISDAEIRARLARLWGRALLFVDTCHSANVIGNHREMNGEARRLANTLSSPESGVIVFSASTGRQKAVEHGDWGNGAFTKALLEGLKGGADFRGDGVVTHQGLSYFLGREVARLTGGRQVPVTAVPMGMVDFALASL